MALQQSSASSPGSAAVMNPMHQQHSDPKVKLAIRAPAERAGQALSSASYNSTDVKKPWADLCQLRASSSYLAFFRHFVSLFQLSCQHLPAAGRTGGQNCQPGLGQTHWDGPGTDLLGHKLIAVNCAGCSQLFPWSWTPYLCSGWILDPRIPF